MSNPSIKLSSRVAFSYRWNKCIDNHEFCFKRLGKSIASFFQGFSGKYTVSVTDVESFLANKDHENSIFSKEIKRKLAKLNTTSVNELATFTVKSSSNILLDKLTNLLASQEFESSDNNFSEKNLKLLNLNDRLLLLTSASQKDKSEIVLRLLSINNLGLSKDLSATTKTEIFSSFIRQDFLPGVEYMLKNDLVSSDRIDADGITPLIGAIKTGSVECINLLLKNGAHSNIPDKDGSMPLHYAAKYPDKNISIQLLDILLKNDASIDETDAQGYTPLHCAVIADNENFLTVLMDQGADINKPDEQGCTPLHYATSNNNEELLKALLDKGAKHDVTNTQDLAPLNLAAKNGNKKLLQLLLAASAHSTNRYSSTVLTQALFDTVSKNHAECLNLLLIKPNDVDVNSTNEDGNTPLHSAVTLGHKECADVLLKVPTINVNIIGSHDMPPLCKALCYSQSECVESLLDNNETDVNVIINSTSMLPLFYAVRSDISLPCFNKFLYAQDLRFDVKDKDGDTPIHCAIRTNNLNNLKELLNVKNMRVHINEKTKDGDTALHCAIKNKKIAYIQALLSQCKDEIDVTLQDSKGMTPLECLNKLEVSGTDYEECKKTLQNLDKKQ